MERASSTSPGGFVSTAGATCMWPTGATTGSRSSPPTANTWPSSEVRAIGPASSNRPISVAVDKHGDIYVADWSNDRVQVLTPDGRYITAFTGDGGLGKWGDDKLHVNWEMVISRGLVRDLKDERALWHPMTLLIDDEGRVLIIDSDHHRIQVYQKDNY